MYRWLSDQDVPNFGGEIPYFHSFDYNRKKFPKARAFNLCVSRDLWSSLGRILGMKMGSLDKELFFDHLVSYRPTKPLIPLVNFHDYVGGGSPPRPVILPLANARNKANVTNPNASGNPSIYPLWKRRFFGSTPSGLDALSRGQKGVGQTTAADW